ncbi:MAG: hypothetical protein AB7O38_16030 [Pirellulaceae bacterium]
MKAIAKPFIVCVAWAVTQTPCAMAGLSWMAQGTGIAIWSTAQQEASSDAERRLAAEQWLKQARQALRDGNLDAAEDYAGRAERLGAGNGPPGSTADSPALVRRDVAAARQNGGRPAAPSQRFAPNRTDAVPPPAGGALLHMSDQSLEALTDDAKVRALQFVNNGRQALKRGDVNEALAWRQKALATGAAFSANEYSPANLTLELKQAGVDPARLAVQPAPAMNVGPDSITRQNLSRLPSIGGSRGGPVPQMQSAPQLSNLSAAKAEAIRLAAQARAALDRGDLLAAKQLASQAESLRIPENEFGANEIRPWEVMLQVDSAINRRNGVVPAANYDAAPNQAAPARSGQYPVTRGLYEPSRDTTRNSLAQGQLPTLAGPESAAQQGGSQGGSQGVRLYEQGVAALSSGDRAGAVAAFQEAWKYEGELPPDVRQQLKDKLVVLTQTVSTPPRTGNEPAPLEEVDSQQQLVFQKLYREIAAEEQAAEKMTTVDPKGALQKMTALRERVSQADLDAAHKKQLLTFVDRNIGRLETFIEQNRGEIELNERNRKVLNEIEQGNLKKYEIDDTIAAKVEEFNNLMEQERFAEAQDIARQVQELAPDNPISRNLTMTGKFGSRLQEQNRIKDMKEQGFYDALTSVEESDVPFDDREVMNFGDAKRWNELSESRRNKLREMQRRLSPAEMQINEALKKQVEVRFDNRPLKEVLDTLGSLTGVNIFLDASGLAAEGITSDHPVTITLQQPISLKSALNVILQPLRLGFVIQNEVLHVTSEQAKGSQTYNETYYVADLVVPIPHFAPSHNVGLPAAIREAHQALGLGYPGSVQLASPISLAENDPANVGTGVLAQAASSYLPGRQGTRPISPNGQFPSNMGGAALADFDTLIDLIQQTIAPDSWVDAGGTGAIESFPTNLSLVISQTQDVHEDIADLLDQLRRLQDLQVAIEVRFITLRDNFFERIGIDFDFQIDDNVLQLRRDDQGPSMAIGLGQDGNPTVDLDIPFDQDTFGAAIPPFGGTLVNGATMGVAILSDIEAFFVVQAAQGDRRSNVLTAPKVTLFNGQLASVNDTSQRPFVTSLIPVVGDFAVAHQPVITVLNEGTQLGVQAVVSPDRRFVRLTLVPFFSQVGDVQEFTFSGTTTTDTGTNVVDPNGDPTGERDNQVTSRAGTTIQLPTFSFTTVSTTVSVPDGGTILLGGIKRLSEGRNEFGVPGLSKIPYVNRLFKNVGIGRDTSSLMLMVTPRIIIQEEEESKLGLNLNP